MFELSFDSGEVVPRLALVTIDRKGEKLNTITPAALDQFDGVFDTIESERDIEAVIVVSGKPDSFVVGADVETFASATDRRDIEAFVRRGHAVLGRVARSKLPFVAAIHGQCLGAGLELALACHYRVCTDDPKTALGVPEIMLGLFPGGGGATRLPRLVGLREGLDMILTGRNVRAKRARRIGLVDQVVAHEALHRAARDAAEKLAAGRLERRSGPEADVVRLALERNPLGRAIVFGQARKTVLRRTKGLYPAPLVALDVIEAGLRTSVQNALELEPPAFAELAVGEVSRALVSLFRRSNELRKQKVHDSEGNEIAGEEIQRLGLVGGGFMGADIAVVAAERGIEARIRDIAAEPLARGLGHVRAHFDRRARRVGARHVFKARSLVSGGLDLRGFEAMDLVIEAVPEDLELKQKVFAELEAKVPPSTILASNTSALPIGSIGERLEHKHRLVGLHFFSPVPKMQLLEIVRTADTSPETIAICLEFATRIGKTPILVRDGPGFYTTRVLGFYLMTALEMLEAGHTIEQIDGGARQVGWPVGPLALLDEVGIDVGTKVAKTLAAALPDRVRTSAAVDRFSAEDRLGRKSGRGFYVYPRKGRKEPDRSIYEFFDDRPTTAPRGEPEELGERLSLVAALEAVRCLEEGIIASPREGDIGAVFGFGYPPLRGGPFRHLSTRGLPTVLTRIEGLREQLGPAFDPPTLLTDLAGRGQDFSTMGGTT
jgi:3-hydroxyacyl-CoA dehydrogenase/enoyl-CoA hydratase/3-hydroxybutyryl-CoA epimerase